MGDYSLRKSCDHLLFHPEGSGGNLQKDPHRMIFSHANSPHTILTESPVSEDISGQQVNCKLEVQCRYSLHTVRFYREGRIGQCILFPEDSSSNFKNERLVACRYKLVLDSAVF